MISKTELAKKTDLSPNTITRIEQGLPCRMETKRKIIRTLGSINSDENEVMASFIRNNIMNEVVIAMDDSWFIAEME